VPDAPPDDPDLAAAWAEGEHLTVDEALSMALGEA
jgi:hypothetical protein